jgi:pyrroline-5-carboxylate reductase
MGSALLHGWNNPDVIVIEPQPVEGLPAGVSKYTDLAQVPAAFVPSLIIFAVKPQVIDNVVPAYARFKGATFLSIAAGKTIAAFEKHLGKSTAIIRAMPNTPAAIGQGISVCVANPNVTAQGKALAEAALKAGGAVEWVSDESLMDAVTALSGSGPAYVFLLVEVLARAGEAMGLAPALAMKLARQTVIGSGHLLQQSPQAAAALRAAVTSPGGTTAAALDVLMQNDALAGLLEQALKAAQQRGRDLS